MVPGGCRAAAAVFDRPLEVKIGDLELFSARLKEFRRDVYDGVIPDNVRHFLALWL